MCKKGMTIKDLFKDRDVYSTRNKNKIIQVFEFLVRDYGFSVTVDDERGMIFYKNIFLIKLEIDKIDGLLIAIKPLSAPDVAYVGLMYIINYLSKGNYIQATIDHNGYISEIMLDQAEYYKQELINACMPLLIGDMSWWAEAYRVITEELHIFSPLGGITDDFQRKVKAYRESL